MDVSINLHRAQNDKYLFITHGSGAGLDAAVGRFVYFFVINFIVFTRQGVVVMRVRFRPSTLIYTYVYYVENIKL